MSFSLHPPGILGYRFCFQKWNIIFSIFKGGRLLSAGSKPSLLFILRDILIKKMFTISSLPLCNWGFFALHLFKLFFLSGQIFVIITFDYFGQFCLKLRLEIFHLFIETRVESTVFFRKSSLPIFKPKNRHSIISISIINTKFPITKASILYFLQRSLNIFPQLWTLFFWSYWLRLFQRRQHSWGNHLWNKYN